MTIADTSVSGGTPVAPISPRSVHIAGARPAAGGALATSARDTQSPELATQRSAVNALRDAASALGGTATDTAGDDAAQLTLPPLPPMPAPAKPPDVPTDDHGQSNIVFADGDADGSLIH